ncbi:MAG: D-aminoacyl-tRNA deacylase [Acidimicrobiales bacterium]|nr:D-aminoacyl-tRNA deacylase [Acidimicrobiales bacterium]
MKALIQRVSEATVTVEGNVVGSIGKGLCVFVGVTHSDTCKIVEKMADKILHLRIFDDESSKMNLSTLDIQAEILIVSQFTLYGDTRKGRRPSWVASAPAEVAEPLIDDLIEVLRIEGINVETGLFRQYMNVQLTNDGPATLQIEVD